MNLQELTQKILEIKNRGFIKTHRLDDTEIGKTLEDLLGIKENNLKLPDVGDIELKAKRIDSQSMLTIATKAPNPRRNLELIRKIFYIYTISTSKLSSFSLI